MTITGVAPARDMATREDVIIGILAAGATRAPACAQKATKST